LQALQHAQLVRRIQAWRGLVGGAVFCDGQRLHLANKNGGAEWGRKLVRAVAKATTGAHGKQGINVAPTSSA
jgi:hypothetical protein